MPTTLLRRLRTRASRLRHAASGVCAKTEVETQTPEVEQREAELAMLRRENASLEAEIQNLEERVRLLEGSGRSTSLGTTGAGYDSYGSYTATPGTADDWSGNEDEGPRHTLSETIRVETSRN